MFRLLHWRTAFMYAALILIATFGSTVIITTQVRQVRLDDLETQLLSVARLLANSATPLLRDGSTPRGLDEIARLWASALAGRVTVISADGTTLGESHEERTEMENHLLRPEVQQALKAGQGSSIRFSTTLGYDMMYAAVPIRTGGGELLGVIRVALPMEEIEKQLSDLRQNVILIGFLAAMLSAILALLLAGRITRTMQQLTELKENLTKGDVRTSLIPAKSDEVGQFTQIIAQAFDRIYGQISTLTVAFDHIADGILITGQNGDITLINATAAHMIGVDQNEVKARSFTDVVPIQPLVDLWRGCGEKSDSPEANIEIEHNGKIFQATVTPFPKARPGGCLLILKDITHARRLESSRSEQIANISHEMRLPLVRLRTVADSLISSSAVKLSVAVADKNGLDVEINNLNDIADDLLGISHLHSGVSPFILTPTWIADVVNPPVERFGFQAEQAGVEFTVSVTPDLPQILADVNRLRLTLRNLLQNAIKFTPPGGCVNLVVEPASQEILFSIQDSGVGIATEDLPRIFDKHDQAQSGSISMGLAIAKQIVIEHGGRIWAESTEDQGSTIYFTLPVAFLDSNNI